MMELPRASLSLLKEVMNAITIGTVLLHSSVKMDFVVLVPLMMIVNTREPATLQLEYASSLIALMKSLMKLAVLQLNTVRILETRLFACLTHVIKTKTVMTTILAMDLLVTYAQTLLQNAQVGSLAIRVPGNVTKSFHVQPGLIARQTFALLNKTELLTVIATPVLTNRTKGNLCALTLLGPQSLLKTSVQVNVSQVDKIKEIVCLLSDKLAHKTNSWPLVVDTMP
jgi:hypothetical protein